MIPSFPLKLTSEDRLTIQKWKWGLPTVYGAVLLVLVLHESNLIELA